MPKILITGRKLTKAKNGMTTDGQCPNGYIKVDGECVKDATRTYTVYETDVPGEYTSKRSASSNGGAYLPVVKVFDFLSGPDENYMNPTISSYYSSLPTKEAKKEFKELWNKYKPSEDAYEEMHGTGQYWPDPFETDRQQHFIDEFEKYINTDEGLKFDASGVPVAKNNFENIVSKNYEYNQRLRNDKKTGNDYYSVDPDTGEIVDPNESTLDYLWRKSNASLAEDFRKNDVTGGVAGTLTNWARNLLYAPSHGALTIAKMLRNDPNKDQNLFEENKNITGWDLSGLSNYPAARQSLSDLTSSFGDVTKNPSWENLGTVGLNTLGLGMNVIGSMPLIGAIEGSVAKQTAKEVPTLTRELAPAFTKQSLRPFSKQAIKQSFRANPFPKTLPSYLANAPVLNEIKATAGLGLRGLGQGLHTLENAVALPYRALTTTVNPLIKRTGIRLTEGSALPLVGHAAPWVHGENLWASGTGVKPVEYISEKVAGEPTTVQQTSTIMPQTYATPNFAGKDTTINLISPSGKVYQTTTQDPNFLKIKDKLIKVTENNYDPNLGGFRLDPNDFLLDGQPIDIDEALSPVFNTSVERKKEFGGSFREIPRLFMYPPEKNIPGRMAYGGMPMFADGGTPPNCDQGYMVDPNDASKCIEDPNYIPIVNLTATQSMVEGASRQADPRPETDTHATFDKDGNPLVNGEPFGSSDIPTVDLDPARNRRQWARTLNKGYDIDPIDRPCPPEKYNPLTGKCFDDTNNFWSKYNKGYSKFSNLLSRGANVANYFHNKAKQKAARKQFDINKYSNAIASGRDRGATEQINTGLTYDPYGRRGYQWQNQASGYGQTEFGGTINGSLLKDTDMGNTVKIKILGGPTEEMAYGGQLGYGFDLGQRNTYAAMPKGKTQTVSNTIKEVPREEANIEAEKGETVYGDVDGDGMYEHMNIEGKRHVDGGTPLNVPEGSFVFSDTKKMRIKDPEMLAKFGLSPRKEGYTPAEIAKKYDVNKYKAVLQDANSDQLMKNTALLMIKNYQKKLAELALIQESMKGFPQGVPEMCKGVLPDELIEQIESQLEQERGQAAPGQEPGAGPNSPMAATEEENAAQYSPEEAMMAPSQNMQEGMMYGGEYAYGGSFDDLEDYDYEAPIMFANGGGTPPNWNPDYEKLKTLLTSPEFADLRTALYNKYKAGRGASDTITEQEYIDNLLETQRQKYVINQAYANRPDYLHSRSWDIGGKNVFYKKVATDLGLPIQSEQDIKRGQQAYLDFADLLQNDPDFSKKYGTRFNIQPIGVPDEPDYLGHRNITRADEWRGNTDIGQLIRLANEVPADTTVFGYICTGRDATNKPQITKTSYANEDARKAAGAFASETEAAKSCSPKSGPNPNPLQEKKKTPVPFDYMTPDLWAIDSANAARVNWYGPFVQDVPYEASNYTPEEWRAKAAELQSQTNDAARTLAAYGPATGLSANLSSVAGKQARNLVGAIADVDARNIQGLNAFKAREQARKDQFRALNAANQGERWKGTTVANQQYDTALNAKAANVLAARMNAWNNRMKLGMENETNKYYFTSPYTGQLIWKSGYGVEDLGNTIGSTIPTYTDYINNIDPSGSPETYKTYINARYGKGSSSTATTKYGGSIQKKYPTFTNKVADMLSNGYGLPF